MGAAKNRQFRVFFGACIIILGILTGYLLFSGQLNFRLNLIRYFGPIAYVLPPAIFTAGFLSIRTKKRPVLVSIQPILMVILAGWWIFSAEQLSSNNTGMQYSSEYAGEVGSSLFRLLSLALPHYISLAASLLLVSIFISLVWTRQVKALSSLFLKIKKPITIQDRAAVVFIASGSIILTGILMNPLGTDTLLFFLFGFLSYLIPVILIHAGVILFTGKTVITILKHLLSLPVLCSIAGGIELLAFKSVSPLPGWYAGGLIGGLPILLLYNVFPLNVSNILSLVISVSLLALLWNRTLLKPLRILQNKFARTPKKPPVQEKPISPGTDTVTSEKPIPAKKKAVPPGKDLPYPIPLLPEPPQADETHRKDLAFDLDSIEASIITTVKELTGITLARAPGKEPVLGLQSMRLSFVPISSSQGAIRKLLGITHDLALALQRSPIQISLKDVVTIEVPLLQHQREFVYIKPLLQECLAAPQPSYLIGKTLEGTPLDLPVSRCLNILIGGQTGSGKSVLLHSIIFGLIFRWKPSEVQLALYDHKIEEFSRYSSIPHLWHPPANSLESFEALLVNLEQELNRRKQSREKNPDSKFPLLVTIMDEFRGLNSDRLMTLIAECRSLQMSFILATQYPRADVISTPIKANLTTGICFRMRDKTGSRLIIGESGGEALMDKGDCLVHTPFSFEHAQAAYCTPDDLKALSQWVKK